MLIIIDNIIIFDETWFTFITFLFSILSTACIKGDLIMFNSDDFMLDFVLDFDLFPDFLAISIYIRYKYLITYIIM
jgi:hypothetical protein